MIRFRTRRKARDLPKKIFPVSQRKNETYLKEMRRLAEECRMGNAVIIYFDKITWRRYLASKTEIESRFGIQRIAALNDGVIFGIPAEPAVSLF